MYVFTPAPGRTWGLTYETLAARLRERDPRETIRLDRGRPDREACLHFGITLGAATLEGKALLSPEGVSVADCSPRSAAAFAIWLRTHVVPRPAPITFNTEWGLDADLPDTPLPRGHHPQLVAAFRTHLTTATRLTAHA